MSNDAGNALVYWKTDCGDRAALLVKEMKLAVHITNSVSFMVACTSSDVETLRAHAVIERVIFEPNLIRGKIVEPADTRYSK